MPAGTGDELDAERLLSVLAAIKQGDFTARMSREQPGLAGKIADALNDIVELNQSLLDELDKVSLTVRTEGCASEPATIQGAAGDWASCVDSVNALVGNVAAHRAFVEQLPDGLLIVDREGRIVMVNSEAERLFGYRREELLGRPQELLVPVRCREKHAVDRATYIADPSARAMGSGVNISGLRKDGTEFSVDISLAPVDTEWGALVVAAVRDVTDRKRTEEELRRREAELRESYERLREAQDGYERARDVAKVWVWEWSLDTGEVHVDSGLGAVLGFESGELPGHIEDWWKRVVHHDDVERVTSAARAHVEGQTPLFEAELRMLHKDGSVRWFLARARAERDDEGRAVRLVGATLDITDRRVLEEQLRQAQKMEAIGNLAGGIAHDFNNLLGVILGFGQMALRDLPRDAPLRPRIEKMLAAADRGAELSHQLLAFSRKQPLDLHVLDLNSVVEEIAKLLPRLLEEDVRLSLRLGEGLGRVKADRGQLEQLLINLAVNARDAMPEGGRLTVETANAELDKAYAETHAGHPEGRFVLLAVSDTGCGMNKETLARIFEPFFTTKPPGKGTGLGLATVYGIVKQSGGYIWVYSEPGQGTTFKIYLPRVEEAEEEEAVPAPSGIWRGSETLLVVEDDDTLLEITCEILEANGYPVLATTQAEAALEMADRHPGPIALLITDVVMPVMNGRELARHLLERRPEMKVLYVSGYTADVILQHGALDPGTALLTKPFTEASLTRTIREVLDSGTRA